MASLIVNRGLLRIGQQASESTNYDAARNIQVMSVDIGATAFSAAHTKLNDSADVTESPGTTYHDQILDATPTESGQTITHVMTLVTGNGNFVIRRIALHDNVSGTVNASSVSLVGGVDGQALTKTADFTLAITLKLTYTSV